MADQKVLKGLDAALHNGFGWFKRRKWHQTKLHRRAAAIHKQSLTYATWSDDDFAAAQDEIREKVNRDPMSALGCLDQAIAILAEAAHRSLNKRPYVVQIMGVLALHDGYVAEMATGEGKTLTVGLAAVLAGWGGRPTHILTANDYLAERDALELAPLFEFCNLRVASCLQDMDVEDRQNFYHSDLVYVTPKILLADILRDELTRRAGSDNLTLPRGIHTAIVDEADSMMIDESITPLIISAPRDVPGLNNAVVWAQERVDQLVQDVDYKIDGRYRRIDLGITNEDPRIMPTDDLPIAWHAKERRISLIKQALQVKHNFTKGVHYVIEDDKVVLIDEFTGRLTGERSLSGGLHQAIEAKENVPLTQPNMPMIQMSFQKFFQRFKRLACTTGTAKEAAVEFWHIYKKPVLAIPTNKPRQVHELPSHLFAHRAEKFDAIAHKAKALAQAGHPVLVGARALADSEDLAQIMGTAGLSVRVLNAIYHKEEGEIIAQAGVPSTITIATNMAGRGVDIHLEPDVLANGGLHVIICEPNDSARVDRQLAGRCGRQGQPGVVHRFFALDDKIFEAQFSRTFCGVLRFVFALQPRLLRLLIDRLTHRAQNRFEKNSYLSRKSLLENEEWLDQALPFNVVR